MVVSFRKKRAAVLPYRLAIWAVVGLLFMGHHLQEHPITASGTFKTSPGVEVTRQADADILVVLDYEAIRQSGPTFGEKDWSATWIQLIEQEIGPVSIATPSTLEQKQLDDARILILTASVSTSMPESFIDRVRRQTLEGMTLVIERPQGRAREIFSAPGDAGLRRGQEITHAEGLEPEFARQLWSMPIFADYIGSTAPREGATTHLSIDGAPVIYAVPFGEGFAITVDFNLGEQLVSLQQGRPRADFQLPGQPDSQSTPRTDDLVAHDSLRGSAIPFADLLSRFIVHGVLQRYAPTPSLWLFPQGAAGAVLFVHEDALLGDGGAWKLEREVAAGGSSTLLTTVDSGLTKEGAEKIHLKGGEIGLAWRLPDPSVAIYERRGAGSFEPVQSPINLETQLKDLRQRLPVGYLRTARSFEGVWSQKWAEPLAALAEAGVRADFSYESPRHRGYSFGTGLPFLAMNEEGMPLGIREYPIIIPPRAQEGPTLEELLESSAAGHHQLITIGTRPALFAEYPDREEFDAWFESFDKIEAHDHVLVNALRFDTYLRQRRASSIRSRFIARSPLPEELRHTHGPTGALLRVRAEAQARGMQLLVPARIGEKELIMARSGTRRVGAEVISQKISTEPGSIIGFPHHRVVLEQGFNNLEFYYH